MRTNILTNEGANSMFGLKRYLDGSFTLILAAAAVAGWTYMSEGADDPAVLKDERVVTEGETLWSIAEHVAEDLDLQREKAVYWIKEENQLQDTTIHPGQTIKVPAEWNGVASD
jgi:hypothetical protein